MCGCLTQDLNDAKLILMMRNKDTTPRIIYHNDPSFQIAVGEEFRQQWGSTSVPGEMDIVGELKRAGLKAMELVEKGKTNKAVYGFKCRIRDERSVMDASRLRIRTWRMWILQRILCLTSDGI
jgi:hypothetical protein